VTSEVDSIHIIEPMMTIIDISELIFSSIVMLIAAGITAHIFHGFGTKRWRETFVGLVLLLIVCTQVNVVKPMLLYYINCCTVVFSGPASYRYSHISCSV
jgi:membrane protein YdbS with pleckstrin-like domain